MYLSQVFMKQGRFLSLPKTSLLSFNGTTSYGELATPWIVTSDFEIEIKFSTTVTESERHLK